MMDSKELDMLVAEKIMGWDPDFEWPHRFTDEDGCTHDRAPEYTTEIRFAWEVVEKLRDDFWFGLHTTNGGGWEACFDNTFIGQYVEGAGTAEMAICLAALRVKGIEI